MSEKIVSEDGKLDLVKWAVVAAIVAGAIYANSYFATESLLVRTLGLLVVAGVAGWLGAQTIRGRAFVNLCLDARVEIRKVVWPTRQETTQTTIVVLIVIFILAFILWLLDWGLNSVISSMIG
ncbi:MAG: preprotein translocase subunit SecE [SAR86 cluster bacterium]|uniref:Protein translocase subunit SecE n=1 Tax=SAR86 cluster bacterium TaxID=2030880 RepID=A0A2A4WYF8_9GAMM|nr:MAG: preprotein translocase subunit SecE [SAR86 cluster bacterium]